MYILGICAAVAAGITFNLGMVIQKVAVMRTRKEGNLFRQLVRSPLWLSGFALQFIVGMPLNMLAQANIGPAIIPGLMSIGLVVLAIAAVWLAHETVSLSDGVGIFLVMAAVALIGFSRLSIDPSGIIFFKRDFLVRLVLFTAAVAALSLICHLFQKQYSRFRGVLRTLNAGLLFVQSNLWLGILMGFLGRWSAGQYTNWDLLPVGAASIITFAGSMLGIGETQRAFQVGDATKLIPIQSLPVQILPLVSYFTVFCLPSPGVMALPLAATAAVLILAGSALLAHRQASIS